MWLSGKESICQCRRHRFDPWVETVPWRRKWQSTSVFLPGESREQRSLADYSPWGHKELDTTEQLTQAGSKLYFLSFPGGASVKEKNMPANAEDVRGLGSVP